MMKQQLATVAVAALVACTSSANLNLDFRAKDDPNPRRLEIGAQVAGLCLGLILSWSGGDAPAPRPTAIR